MKTFFSKFAVVLVFLAVVALLFSSFIVDYVRASNRSNIVNEYRKATADTGYMRLVAMRDDAQLYNEILREKHDSFAADEHGNMGYEDLLRVTGSDVIAMLRIGLIDVELPIFHGSNTRASNIGAGHLQGASLPVGGANTHTVVTAYRGEPASTMLTELDRIMAGDTFEVHVLNQVLVYQVDLVHTVDAGDYDALQIIEGEDYFTIMTGSPRDVNSHWLLVRGKRTDYDNIQHVILSDARRIHTNQVMLVMLVPAIIVTFCIVVFGRRERVKTK
ncbi:MAG: class C sortase [Oscillospiraceae bacterium]|nr:class C sortase [Oscillospiraceae bacterium]